MNYPSGSFHDPGAPCNYREPLMAEWDGDREGICRICDEQDEFGKIVELNEKCVCKKCFEPEPTEEE